MSLKFSIFFFNSMTLFSVQNFRDVVDFLIEFVGLAKFMMFSKIYIFYLEFFVETNKNF